VQRAFRLESYHSYLLANNIVVAELVENISGWDSVTSALDEIRVCHEESQIFFGGVFDQLDSLCGSLLSRQQHIEKQAAQQRDNILATDAVDDQRWDSLLKEFEEGRAEIRGAQKTVQEQIVRLVDAAEDLAAARNDFQTVRGELARHGEELTAIRSQTLAASQEVESSIKDKIREMDDQCLLLEKERAEMEKAVESNIKNKIHDMEQQQSLLEKERAAMEKELASVGNRAAEIADLLAEQKRVSAPQQGQWAEEMKQMRALLENLTLQIAQSKRHVESSPAAKSLTGVAAAATGDPVLESVLAQFQVLQQDRVFRRSESGG
jgi:chromosome segregation ATPase